MLLVFAVAILSTGFSEAALNCNMPASAVCILTDKPPFPSTPEEWDVACNFIIGFLECSAEQEEQCFNYVERTLDQIREVTNFAREEACNNETVLYRTVRDNIQCIKDELLRENGCDTNYNDDAKMIQFGIALREQGLENTALEGKNTVFCITQLYLYACRANLLSKNCGEDAKHAFTEVFKNAMYPTNDCEELILDDLPAIARALETEGFKDVELEEIFENEK